MLLEDAPTEWPRRIRPDLRYSVRSVTDAFSFLARGSRGGLGDNLKRVSLTNRAGSIKTTALIVPLYARHSLRNLLFTQLLVYL